MPYFSIIIPTLNEEDYLPRLLQNLNNQTFSDFDVTVVDGQSEDQTTTIVTTFPAKFPLNLIKATKRNVSYQRNLGASSTQGKVLIFFDADTQIPKQFLEKLHQIFETKKPHFLTTYMKIDSRKPTEQWFSAFSNVIMEIGRIIKTPGAYGAMQAIKHGVFDDIGGYDESTKFGEDSQLFQKAQDYNYKFLVATSPRYVFSLRRLRAEGTLDTLYQYLKLNLTLATNGYHSPSIHYEMGGGRYKQMKYHSMTQRFNRIFAKLKKRTTEQSKSIATFLKLLK